MAARAMRVNIVVNVTDRTVPKAVSSGSVYGVVTRQTMFGLHKYSANTKNTDPVCTKTTIVTFVRDEDAKDFVRILDDFQNKKATFSREVRFDNSVAILENQTVQPNDDGKTRVTDSLKPLQTEPIPYSHMEQLCILHFFDMLVVYDKRISLVSENEYNLDVSCYEYRTYEYPNRVIQEKIFRNMLY